MVKKRRLNNSKVRRRRSRSPQSGDEVVSARDRLKGALLGLLPHSEEESESSDDDRSKRNSTKKKALEKSSQEPSGFRQAFKMKLYDRTVDLSSFTDNTPLYPICRAWITNQSPSLTSPSASVKSEMSPDNKEIIDVKEEPIGEGEVRRNIYKLPGPTHVIDNAKKIRVPPLIPRETQFPSVSQNDSDCPSKEELLRDNLAHWVKVRRSWMKASWANEQRYSRSINILTSIFYNSQKPF